MSIKEFWEEEPDLLWTYRKSYMDEKKLQSELSNQQAWLNGLYVFDAISKAIYNNFVRKNGQEAKAYIEKPYDFDKDKKDVIKEEQLKNEQEVKEALYRMKQALK